ncbi:hypothetical protein D5274_08590 [bacterium 1XD42-94]|nr:hypothetical protein [bacterium 1XD42-76]NBK05200.1 hypothetical protein [bacterium 1XD42-94]
MKEMVKMLWKETYGNVSFHIPSIAYVFTKEKGKNAFFSLFCGYTFAYSRFIICLCSNTRRRTRKETMCGRVFKE